MKKINIKKKFADTLELPDEFVYDVPKISILGFSGIEIINYKSIIEYEEEKIRINTKDKIISISGEKLEIKNITNEEISISGKIKGVVFE